MILPSFFKQARDIRIGFYSDEAEYEDAQEIAKQVQIREGTGWNKLLRKFFNEHAKSNDGTSTQNTEGASFERLAFHEKINEIG